MQVHPLPRQHTRLCQWSTVVHPEQCLPEGTSAGNGETHWVLWFPCRIITTHKLETLWPCRSRGHAPWTWHLSEVQPRHKFLRRSPISRSPPLPDHPARSWIPPLPGRMEYQKKLFNLFNRNQQGTNWMYPSFLVVHCKIALTLNRPENNHIAGSVMILCAEAIGTKNTQDCCTYIVEKYTYTDVVLLANPWHTFLWSILIFLLMLSRNGQFQNLLLLTMIASVAAK